MLDIFKKFTIPLFFLVIAASLGFLVRVNFYFPIAGFNFLNYVQAHSHVAFLGWGFLGTTILLNNIFLSKTQQSKSVYKAIFSILALSIFGMIFSFSLQGYKAFSIVLLATFLLTSYVYCYTFLNDIKAINKVVIEMKFIKTAIYFYILSSIGIWLVAPIIIHYGKNYIFHDTIYFYLHFLYNGFFVFALFGLLFRILKNQGVHFSRYALSKFYLVTLIACIPAYALSLTWHSKNIVIIIVGFVAAFIQLISLKYLYQIVKDISNSKVNTGIGAILLKIAMLSYFFKIIAQFLSAFPVIMNKITVLKMYFVIGYIHLFTLGFMSLLLIYLANKSGMVFLNKRFSKFSIILIVIGILCTEIWMFFYGVLSLLKVSIKLSFDAGILLFTIPLFLGILLLFIAYTNLTSKYRI